MDNLLVIVQENSGWFFALVSFLVWVRQLIKSSNYRKVKGYICNSVEEWFQLEKLSEKLKISRGKLTEVLQKLENEGVIKDTIVSGSPKYFLFVKMV